MMIKCLESSFYELTKFRVNSRNMKLLQQMSIGSIFDNFSINGNSYVSNEAMLNMNFMSEFTMFKKRKRNRKMSNSIMNYSASIKKGEEDESIFNYEVLKNKREEDGYLKVRFIAKYRKSFEGNDEMDNSSLKLDRASELV